MSVNKVILVGNVGKDPEIRYLDGNAQNGQSAKVATFTLATSEKYRDRNGNLQENTEWHNLVAWRQTADICERFVKKGSQLYIEGRLRTRNYTDQQGVKKYTTEILVDNLQLLGRRESNDGTYQGASQQGGGYVPQQGGYTPQQPSYQQPAQRPSSAFQSQPAPSYQPQQTYQHPAPSYQPKPAAQVQPQASVQNIDINIDDAQGDDLPF